MSGKGKKSRRSKPPSPLGPGEIADRERRITDGIIVPYNRQNILVRLLDTAIMLWFYEWDPLSVHILGSASYRTLSDVIKKDGKEPWLTQIIGHEQLTRAYDFLRHSSSDLTEVLDFAPQTNITVFEDVFGHRTTFMSILMFRLLFELPVTTEDQRVAMGHLRAKYVPKKAVIKDFSQLSRLEFFKRSVALFESGGIG